MNMSIVHVNRCVQIMAWRKLASLNPMHDPNRSYRWVWFVHDFTFSKCIVLIFIQFIDHSLERFKYDRGRNDTTEWHLHCINEPSFISFQYDSVSPKFSLQFNSYKMIIWLIKIRQKWSVQLFSRKYHNFLIHQILFIFQGMKSCLTSQLINKLNNFRCWSYQ